MLSIAERYARRAEARRLAQELMARHGLDGWSFGFNRRTRSLGLCRYATRTMELSVYPMCGHTTDKGRPRSQRTPIRPRRGCAL
jgi:hypothetical protein